MEQRKENKKTATFSGKLFNIFLTGIGAILPIVLFVIFIDWIGKLVLECVEKITPEFLILCGFSEIQANALVFLILCGIVFLIGLLMNQEKIGKIFEDFVLRVPILSFMYKVVNIISITKNTTFGDPVMVNTYVGVYEIGFITNQDPKEFRECSGEPDLIAVVIPFSPLTSYRVLLVEPGNLKYIKMPKAIAVCLSFILSLGAVLGNLKGKSGLTNGILKESHSWFGVRLFFNLNVLFFCCGMI